MEHNQSESYGVVLDPLSFELGKIYAFAEIVSAGVKKLALSPPLSPEEMGRFHGPAKKVAKEWGVSLYLEKKLLTTDLFDEEMTMGKHVLLVYKDSAVKDAYIALKKEKAELMQKNQYTGQKRKNIAVRMGRLLSYNPKFLEERLGGRHTQKR